MEMKVTFSEENGAFTPEFGEVQVIDAGGVASVTQTTTSTEDGGVNVVTIALTNGEKSTFRVRNGSRGSDGVDGKDGADGKPGQPGDPGKDGKSATHRWDGTVLTITSASGTTSADLKGEKGEPGDPGKDGKDGADGKPGENYVLTDEDRADIAQQAAVLVEDGDVLANKAAKPLIIYADNAPNTGTNSESGIPIFTIGYSPSDLKNHADNGGSVIIVRYNRHYSMYDATEESAKFRFIEATDTQVDWYHAVLDANKAVTITKTTHKSRMETTTGGAVGQIPRIKSLSSKGFPLTWEFVDITDVLPNGDEVSY